MAPKTAKQKFLVIAPAVLFLGSTAAAAVHFIATASKPDTAVDAQATIDR